MSDPEPETDVVNFVAQDHPEGVTLTVPRALYAPSWRMGPVCFQVFCADYSVCPNSEAPSIL